MATLFVCRFFLGSFMNVFHDHVKAVWQWWLKAIAQILIESGMEAQLAQHRAKDYAIAFQGALILTQGLDEEM